MNGTVNPQEQLPGHVPRKPLLCFRALFSEFGVREPANQVKSPTPGRAIFCWGRQTVNIIGKYRICYYATGKRPRKDSGGPRVAGGG